MTNAEALRIAAKQSVPRRESDLMLEFAKYIEESEAQLALANTALEEADQYFAWLQGEQNARIADRAWSEGLVYRMVRASMKEKP